MSRLVASGVVRLVLKYLVAGAPASMTFHVSTGSPPTAMELATLLQLLVNWDTTGIFGIDRGYQQFRSAGSVLLGADGWSMGTEADRAQGRADAVTREAGLDPAPPLPNAVAPLMHWLTLPGSGRKLGRTYMAGLPPTVMDADRPNRLAADAIPALESTWRTWPQALVTGGYGVPVLLTYRVKGVTPPDLPISVISDVSARSALCGTQRRRLDRDSVS